MGFVSDFLDAMEYLIQKYQKECTTIYSGTVQSVSDKSCSMNVNGNVYNNIAYYGIAPIVGNSYRVFVPFNNMSLAFIIVPSTTTSGRSDVSSVNGKTGNVVLTSGDVGAVSKTGDTMTGNLTVGSASLQTNGYVTGTWLKTTANTSLGSAASKIAVINDGWVYSRTTEQIKSDIGLGNVDNVKQYSASNPPPYPVTSVNGKTGDVVLDAGGTSGTNIITSTSQPLEQSVGDYWYHVTGTANI